MVHHGAMPAAFHPVLRTLFVLATLMLFQGAWAQGFAFVALGDLPYGPPEKAGPPYRALIGAINREQPSFSIHVGDIKSGGSVCSDEEFKQQLFHFSLFEAGVVYTPGDNEWTDCHRPSNGSYDPQERLQMLRRLFFAPGRSLGRHPIAVQSQSERMPAHAAFVENLRWMHQGVVFITLHVVGSNNNLDPRRSRTLAEFTSRESANMAWLRDSFAWARAQGGKAVVVAMQANPLGLINLLGDVGPETGFHATIAQTLLPLVRDAGVPVLLIHGDTHTFRFDVPFRLQGQLLPGMQRLEVPGGHDVRAVRVDVDLSRPSPFSVRMIASD